MWMTQRHQRQQPGLTRNPSTSILPTPLEDPQEVGPLKKMFVVRVRALLAGARSDKTPPPPRGGQTGAQGRSHRDYSKSAGQLLEEVMGRSQSNSSSLPDRKLCFRMIQQGIRSRVTCGGCVDWGRTTLS